MKDDLVEIEASLIRARKRAEKWPRLKPILERLDDVYNDVMAELVSLNPKEKRK